MPKNGTALRFTRTLVFGAVISFLLLLGIEFAAAREIERVEDMMFAVAEQSEHSSFLVGAVAEQLARLHANIASAVRRPPERMGVFEKRIAGVRSALRKTVSDVPAVLHPNQRKLWDALRPKIDGLERHLLSAFALARSGEHERAAKIIDDDADALTAVYEALDALYQGNEAQLQTELQNARSRAERIRLIEAFMGICLLIGTMLIWFAVLRAIRNQARLLAEYTARLESVNADLDAFAGRVAHDLKNALTPLAMAPDMLRAPNKPDERVGAIANRIERASRKLVAIIDGLLSFSRAGKMVEVSETAPLHQVVDEVLEELEPLVSQVDVTVEKAVDDTVVAKCSPGLLHVLLANLCNNAVKFMAGRETRRLRISTPSGDSWCVIRIEDTGPGIPAHARERIFDPFYRVPGTEEPGTGLGLATVRRIVQAHGGKVTVDSTEGKGSSFEVRLPLESSTKDSPKVSASSMVHSSAP